MGMPRIVDTKIRRNLRRYVLQVGIATIALVATLAAEQIVAGGEEARAVLVAAIASTGFVLFISPYSLSATPRHAIGGHALALAIGTPLALLADPNMVGDWIVGDWLDAIPMLFVLYAALGVGLTMFLMAATNTEHPPAAGTALGLVAHGFSWDLIAFVVTAVLIMVAIHRLVRQHLTDLY